jgi:hypothetical protein
MAAKLVAICAIRPKTAGASEGREVSPRKFPVLDVLDIVAEKWWFNSRSVPE